MKVPFAPVIIPDDFGDKRGPLNIDNGSPTTRSSYTDAVAYKVQNQCGLFAGVKFACSTTINQIIDCEIVQQASLSIKGTVPPGSTGSGDVASMYDLIIDSIGDAINAAQV